MYRALVLTALVGAGSLSMALSAQGPPGPSAAAIAAVGIERVKDGLYVITGATPGNAFAGGNTAAFIAGDGVTLVDTKLPGFGPTILERLRSVTSKPVIRIINTHAHADHTGGNLAFGAGVQTVVHAGADGAMRRAKNLAPRTTFGERWTVGAGRDQIDVYYFGRGHTDGDAFVVFPSQRTVHAGDMFPWKALPFIDAPNGGSAVEHAKSLAAALMGIANVDTVIGGHMPVSTWTEFREYADFSQDFVAYAVRAMKAAKTADQAAAEYVVPARFRGYAATAAPNLTVRDSLQQIYNELSAPPAAQVGPPDLPAVTVRGQTYTPRSILARNMGSEEDQTTAFPPHRIAGNIYYVGTRTLSAFLVATPAGHILINTTYERNVRTIERSVAQLGFAFSDVRIVLGTHAHGDHQEGDALAKTMTGAQVMAMAEDVPALESIRPGGKPHPIDRTLKDGDRVTLGGTTLVARLTAGHTRGCTTWTTQVLEGGRALNVVLACSYRAPAPVTPAIEAEFTRTFSLIRTLPCDVPLAITPRSTTWPPSTRG